MIDRTEHGNDGRTCAQTCNCLRTPAPTLANPAIWRHEFNFGSTSTNSLRTAAKDARAACAHRASGLLATESVFTEHVWNTSEAAAPPRREARFATTCWNKGGIRAHRSGNTCRERLRF